MPWQTSVLLRSWDAGNRLNQPVQSFQSVSPMYASRRRREPSVRGGPTVCHEQPHPWDDSLRRNVCQTATASPVPPQGEATTPCPEALWQQ